MAHVRPAGNQGIPAMAQPTAEHSPVNVTHVLKGIAFPARRQQLLSHAKQNGASKDVLSEIQHLPDHEYGTMAEIMKAFGKSH
jgi:hypothetical protein